MEFDLQDRDIVELLTKLKNTDEVYPTDLLTVRRQNYIRRIAEISVGLGATAGWKTIFKSGRSGTFAPRLSSLFESALIVAIVAQTGVIAYFYQDEVKEILQSFSSSPRVEEVISPPSTQAPLYEIPITGLDTPTLIPTETATSTSTPTVTSSAEIDDSAGNSSSEGNRQLTATTIPKRNNGNQSGQTPEPVRTREPDRDPRPSETP